MAKRKRPTAESQDNELKKVSPEDLLVGKRNVPPTALNDIKLTEKQIELTKMIERNDITTIFGPAGTSKTFTTCYYIINALKTNKFKKIILTKPIKEAGENLGFLPGDVNDKIDPHYESFRNNFEKMIKKDNFKKLVEREIIELKPLAYMRGITADSTLFFMDEAQNVTIKQLMLFITRMGKDSKMIIAGDTRQYDIAKSKMALPYLQEHILNDIPGTAHFEFSDEDNMRHGIIRHITEKYELLKDQNVIPMALF